LQKLFSHRFSQNIWRILPHADPDVNEWALELREVTEKKVSFALIDLNSQTIRWLATPEHSDWWTSMTGFADHQIFLHHYRYPELPQPTDLSAISSLDGAWLWTLPNYVLVKTLGEGQLEVVTTAAGNVEYACCDSVSGQISERRSDNQTVHEVILKQPVRYNKGNVYFEKMSAYLQSHFNINNPVCIDYLDHRPYMMFSYYIYQQDKFVQHLLLITEKNEVVLHEKLSEERDGIGQSTVMLKNSVLVYLKNNNEFSSLKLSN
jgi:hypothetical protein